MTSVTVSLGLLGLLLVINMEIFHLQESKYGNKTVKTLNLSSSKTFRLIYSLVREKIFNSEFMNI